MTSKVIAYRQDRLGGRLRCIVNAQRIAKFFGLDYKVAWPVGYFAKDLANPSQLFCEKFVSDHFVLGKNAIDQLGPFSSLREGFDFKVAEQAIEEGLPVWVENLADVVVLPGQTKEKAVLEFQEFAQKLPYSAQVNAGLEEFAARYNPASTIALHIRRGDIVQDGVWSQKYWPTKYVPYEYYDVLIRTETDAQFIVFSDSEFVHNRYMSEFGISSVQNIVDFEALESAQKDLLELIVLSRCRRICAGENSVFSSFAALVGGALKTNLPDDLAPEKRQTANNELVARAQKGIDQFENQHDFAQSVFRAANNLRTAGSPEKAVELTTLATDQGVKSAFLSRSLLVDAVSQQDDQLVLKLCETIIEQKPFSFRTARWPGSCSEYSRLSLLSASSLVARKKNRLAASRLVNALTTRSRWLPFDLLSDKLLRNLKNGQGNVPPTTWGRWPDHLARPTGGKSFRDFLGPLKDRLDANSQSQMWSVSWQLDWECLMFFPNPDLLEGYCKHISDNSKNSADIMTVSLSCLADLVLGDSVSARRKMKIIFADGLNLLPVQKALNHKRISQIASYLGDKELAEAQALQAYETLSSSAFKCFLAEQRLKNGRREEALGVFVDLQSSPLFLLKFLHKNFDKNELSSIGWSTKKMNQSFVKLARLTSR